MYAIGQVSHGSLGHAPGAATALSLHCHQPVCTFCIFVTHCSSTTTTTSSCTCSPSSSRSHCLLWVYTYIHDHEPIQPAGRLCCCSCEFGLLSEHYIALPANDETNEPAVESFEHPHASCTCSHARAQTCACIAEFTYKSPTCTLGRPKLCLCCIHACMHAHTHLYKRLP